MLQGFGRFVMRGNVVDLAVAVVVGSAFNAVVAALVRDLVTPLITAVAGKPDFGALRFTVNSSVFAYGDFVNAVLSFLVVSAAVYFLVVTPVNALMERVRPKAEAAVATLCPECLSEVPAAARRCRACTATMTPVSAS